MKKNLHLIALVLFALAVASYFLFGLTIAFVLALVGLFVDAVAWFAMVGSRRDDESI
jgi:hypothetical protein